jgi:hypothetical protein
MRPSALPPTAPPGRVFREQVRTVGLEWERAHWTALGAFALIIPLSFVPMWLGLDGPGFPEGVGPEAFWATWPHDPTLGGAFLVAILVVWVVGGRLWYPHGPRIRILAAPVDRRTHELLRAAAGAAWVLPLAWLALGAGILLHRASAGAWPAAGGGGWLALLCGPAVVYLLVSAGFLRHTRRSVIVTCTVAGAAVAALYAPHVLPPSVGAVVGFVFLDELGLFTAFAGGSWSALLLWSGAAGSLLVVRAGGHAEAEGGGRVKGRDRAQGGVRAQDGVPAPVTPRMPATQRDLHPSGRLPARPPLQAVVREHVRSLPDSMSGLGIAIAFALGLWSGAVWADVRVLQPETWMGLLADSSVLARVFGIALVLYVLAGDTPRMAPGAYPRLGAPPFSRRSWVLSRAGVWVAATIAVVVTAQLALGLAASIAGVGEGFQAGPLALVQTVILVLAAGCFGSAVTARYEQPLPMLVGGVTGIVVGGMFAVILVDVFLFRIPEALVHALILEGALAGRVTGGGALVLAAWILLFGAASWHAAGRREVSER